MQLRIKLITLYYLICTFIMSRKVTNPFLYKIPIATFVLSWLEGTGNIVPTPSLCYKLCTSRCTVELMRVGWYTYVSLALQTLLDDWVASQCYYLLCAFQTISNPKQHVFHSYDVKLINLKLIGTMPPHIPFVKSQYSIHTPAPFLLSKVNNDQWNYY